MYVAGYERHQRAVAGFHDERPVLRDVHGRALEQVVLVFHDDTAAQRVDHAFVLVQDHVVLALVEGAVQPLELDEQVVDELFTGYGLAQLLLDGGGRLLDARREGEHLHVHVDAEPEHDVLDRVDVHGHVGEDAAHLAAADEHVIRPVDLRPGHRGHGSSCTPPLPRQG